MERGRVAEVVAANVGRTVLIGRGRELDLIANALEVSRTEGLRVVLIVGEAGIGKTRLLTEALADGLRRGALAVVGRCLDERGMPPYMPWINLAASLSGTDAGKSAGQELRALLLDSEDPDPSPATGGMERRRIRLFEAIRDAIAALARRQPVIVGFDDLQWSDPSSNQLLRYLAGRLADAPLLIVGASRVEEMEPNLEFARTRAEFDRKRLLTEIHLRRFEERETGALVASLMGGEQPEIVGSVHAVSEGNPFLAEEFVRALARGDAANPDWRANSARPGDAGSIIRDRASRLPGRALETLQWAALAGREVSVDLLASACGFGAEIVGEDLDLAVTDGLLLEVGAAEFASQPMASDYVFVHDRLREAIAQAIPPSRRRAMHAALADAYGRLARADDVAALLSTRVHHLRSARQWLRAAEVAGRLAVVALASHAFDESAAAWGIVIELSPTRAAAGDAWLSLGDARMFSGQGAALDAYRQAEDRFMAAGDRTGVAQALHRIGVARARREEQDAAIESFRASVAIWESLPAGPIRDRDLAAVLVELGSVLGTGTGRYDEAVRIGRQAIDLAARDVGNPALEAGARLALAQSLMRMGDLPGGREMLEPGLPLAVGVHRLDLAAEIAGSLANHAYWIGDLDASERFARRRLEFGGRSGDPFSMRHVRPWLANIAMARGNWTVARGLIAEAMADVGRVDSPEPRAFLNQLDGMIHLRLGEVDDAVAKLESAIAGFRSIGDATLPWYLGVLASAYLAHGDREAALAAGEETWRLVDALPAGSLPRGPALAHLGIVAARTADAAAARRVYPLLLPHAGQHHWVLMDRVLGMLSGVQGDRKAAQRHFAEAATLAVRGGIRPELALTQAERAVLPGDDVALAEAAARLRALGMVEEARHFGSMQPAGKPPTHPAGLSGREVEVIALVAKGMTNREIGARLGISEKTVTNHLTHIFTKAEIDNRAAAVDFAHRHGLAR